MLLRLAELLPFAGVTDLRLSGAPERNWPGWYRALSSFPAVHTLWILGEGALTALYPTNMGTSSMRWFVDPRGNAPEPQLLLPALKTLYLQRVGGVKDREPDYFSDFKRTHLLQFMKARIEEGVPLETTEIVEGYWRGNFRGQLRNLVPAVRVLDEVPSGLLWGNDEYC